MEFATKTFEELTTRELYEILKVRCAIFAVEQQMNCQDMDDVDFRSDHIYLQENGKIFAYFRAFVADEEQGVLQIGRCLTTIHGKGWGRCLMEQGLRLLMEQYQPRKIVLHAQKPAVGFYEKFGFSVCSPEYSEEGIPHYTMELTL